MSGTLLKRKFDCKNGIPVVFCDWKKNYSYFHGLVS